MLPDHYLAEMKKILDKEEYEKLLQSYQEEPNRSIRLQLEKITPKEWEKINPFKTNPIPIVQGGYYIEDQKIGNHPYHHAGLFYVQEPSAMLPSNLITIKKDAQILDLCAAPGGKTLALSNQVPNGFVLANEINYKRARKLLSNVERLGLKNVIISSMKPYDLQKQYQGYFDVILIDAPCSGEGMFRKDEKAIKEWSKEKVEEISSIQETILSQAATMLKENGYLIYSTCTFNLQENEQQIIKFLKKQSFEIVKLPSSLNPYTKEGIIIDPHYHTNQAKRCYPFLYGEGQFMIVLQKKETHCLPRIENQLQELSQEESKIVQEFMKDNLKSNQYHIKKYQNNIIIVPSINIEIPKLTLLSCFVKMGEINKNRFIPHHQFIKAYGTDFKNQCNLAINDIRIIAYLKGEEIKAKVEDGYGVILVDEYPLGLFKAKNQTLKNHYPKGLCYQ